MLLRNLLRKREEGIKLCQIGECQSLEVRNSDCE